MGVPVSGSASLPWRLLAVFLVLAAAIVTIGRWAYVSQASHLAQISALGVALAIATGALLFWLFWRKQQLRAQLAAACALHASQVDLARAQAIGRIGSWQLNLQRNELLWSAEAHRIFGIPEGTPLTYERFLAAVHPEDRSHVDRMWQAAMRGTPYDIVHRIQPGEKVKWIRERAELEFDADGQLVGGHGTCQDVTELQAAQAALRASQQRFAGIVESAMDAIISVDEDQRIVLFNAAAEAMFGCPASAAIGSPLERFIPLSGRERHAEHVRRFARTGTTSRAMGHLGALRGLREDGSEFPLEASISQIAIDGQKLFTVILRDISERVRNEEEIRRLNADLERRVEARTAELAETNEALLRSNLELQHFAHVAAHDLQTPLRSIAGFAQILQQESGGKLGERADQCIAQVVDNTKRMQTLIRDLLVYARLDAQARPLVPTDMRQLCAEVRATLAAAIGAEAEISCCGDLPVVMADRTQLAQVLQNLFENGIKYNRQKPPRVHLSARLQGEEWVFSVRDNGIGIDPKYHERIFEIFRRLHTHHEYSGSGIGLAICQRVVARHGGRIWVESQAGAGSTFHFTLPADKVITHE